MSRRRVAFLAVLLLIATAAVSLWRIAPRVDEGHSPVSLSKLKRHVAKVAAEPHPVESDANRRVRDYIVSELRLLGLDPQVQSGRIISPRGREIFVENIVCRVAAAERRGARTSTRESSLEAARSSSPAALVVCHYDSHPRAPGAGDDANAVAGMLEVARLLCESGPPMRDIILLFTDGEEYGLLGAQVWVRDNPDLMGCQVVANFEARGSSGPAVMFETAGGPLDLFYHGYARRSPHPVTSSLAAAVYERMPNGTDFTVFKLAGMSGLNFAFIGGVENYHTPRDDPAHLSDASLLHQAQQMREVAMYFATRPHAQFARNTAQRELDLIYFDVLALAVISWPGVLAGPLAIAAAGIAGVGIWRLRPRAARIGPALIRLLACLLIVAAWMHLLFYLPFDQGAMRLAPLAFAGAGAAALAALPFVAPRGRRHERTTTAVVLAMLALGALTTGFLFPPGSYVLLIPTIALGLAACVPIRSKALGFALAAAISTIILIPLVWLMTQALMIRLLAAPVILLVVLSWLWRPAVAPLLRGRWRIALSFATGAVAVFGFVLVM